MKEYLKMADVFDCEVENDANLMFSDSLGNIADFSGHKTQCRYSAHAINSHDELVQMNKELLAALDSVANCGRGSSGRIILDDFDEQCLVNTIKKAKGCAA